MSAAVRGVRAGTYPPRALAAWASLPPLYHAWAMTAGGETVLVAERGAALLGYASLRGAELTALFVRPSASRRGVASALLARVEALARRRGLARLRVDAARSGVAFYAARGFAGRRVVRVPLPGAALLAVRMTKALSQRRGRRSGQRPPGLHGRSRGHQPGTARR
jgi:GNAT superfamily N-acetyltransferase